jgi:hypothetical protein
MICPKCNFNQPEANTECAGCGIVFNKYYAHKESLLKYDQSVTSSIQEDTAKNRPAPYTINLIKELFLHVKPEINPFYFGGRVLFFLIIVIWGWKFIFTPLESNYTGKSFMHMINLPFHEAGHILFRPFGEFLSVLGGSMGQLLIPLTCFMTFIIKSRDTFAATISIWWLGESFMDLAPYINDARALRLILLGGVTGRDVPGYHDWEYILTRLGWLEYDHTLAGIAYATGILLMLLSFIWGGYLLYKQYKNIEMFST